MKKYLYLLIALTAMAVPALASNLTLTVRNDADQIISYTATVTADNQSKTTGGDGRVRFTDLPDGVVNVYVSCPGYYSRIVPMTLYGENAEEVKLWKNRGKITIYVRNPGNGVLSNSTVICNGETQTFNASGNFVFSDVPDGLQTVNVSSVGYYPQSVDIEMNGKNKEATVVLRPSRAQVTVSPYYPTGSRIGDAAVTLNGETQPSSASGNYTFCNVPDGVHTVTIEKDGYYARIFDITVAGAAMTVPVTLYPSGARVSVTLYYEGGSKVNAADITFNNETITSSPSGVYTFYNVPDGTHELVVEKAGYYTRRSEVTVSGENKNVDIVLCNSGSDVKVNVYNKSGTKVSSANVTLNGETQTWSASGVFTFSNVPDGTHTLTVEKNHYYTQSPKITVAGKDLETDVYLYDSGSSALTMSLTYESGSGIGNGAYAFIDGDEEHSEVVGTSGVIGFSDVPDGVHTVTVKKDGYYTREIEVVTAGNNKNVPVTLCDTGSKVTVPVSFEDNTNVINAEVTLNGETQTYSASGNYVFYNVPDGVYTLNIAKTHYYTRNIEVTVNGSDVEVPVTIYNSDATVTVPVSYENGNLVINADVTLNGQTQTYSASGNYVFSNVPDGVHNVTVHKDGYYDRNIEITVAGADVTVPVTIFNSVSTVEISPMDPYGIRLSDASVNFNGDTQTWSASGIFTFRNVPDGIYTLNMGHKDYLPVSLELTVLGQDYSIDVPFQTYQKLPEGDVFGYVRDSVGNPIAGATVTCGGLNLTTGVDGSFRFPDVPNGAYTVTASADGFIPASGQAEIDFASFYLTINLDSALGSAFGYITDRAGTPIKNASVACNGATVLTADDGLYRLPAMINGDYEATVTVSGFEGGSLSFVLDGGAKMVSTSLKLATGSLSGYVTDLGFNPIPGATVSVEGHTATAAADGSYTVTGIPNGSHAVTVSADGFISVTSSVTADGGAVRNNFALKAARGDIWGHVKDTGGNALKDVDVTLGETTVKTDAEGIYTIPNVPNGAYTMDVAKDNFIPASAGVTVDGKSVYLDFIIAPDSGDVSGYVTDAGFNPIAGAAVTMGEYSATTGADGSYVIAAPKNGDYTLTATAPGFYTVSKEITVSSEPVKHDFVLASDNGVIYGYVTDPGGNPVAGATVSDGTTSVTAGETGLYVFPAGNGEYTLRANFDGYASSAVTVVIDGKSIQQDIVMNHNIAEVSGHVVDEFGAPIADATVSCGTVTATTGDDGKYSMVIGYGEKTLTASAEGYISVSSQVAVDNTKVTEDFTLKAAKGKIVGYVRDIYGAPIGGATVSAGSTSATTNASGWYELTLPDSEYNVTCEAVGYGAYGRTVTVNGKTVYLNIYLKDDNVDLEASNLPNIVKTAPDGGYYLFEGLTVSAVFKDCVYATDGLRGIKIVGSGLTGGKFNISGIIGTDAKGERYIMADSVTVTDPNAKVRPTYVNWNAVGGSDFGLQKGAKDTKGTNNIGMFVKSLGVVGKEIIVGEGSAYQAGDALLVTGVVTLDDDGNSAIRMISVEKMN